MDSVFISELKLESEELGLKGRVDRVEIDRKNNLIIPYELKSRNEKIYLSDQIQLTAYAMLLEFLHKKKIDKGFIESGSNKSEFLITPEDKNNVLTLAEEVRNLKQGLPPPILSNFNKCKNCSMRDICPNI